MKRIILLALPLGVLAWLPPRAAACSTIMAGKLATADGSVLMSHSCDGDVMGLVYVMPAESYPPGTRLPMYWNVPRPTTYEEYQAYLRRGYDQVGMLPVTETYRSLILGGNLESMTTGGLNEHGLCIAIEFLPMRKGLACDHGRVGPNSNHWTTSLIANGLLRAKTAREAIRLIGAMIEEHGFLYYRAPSAGVALPIADDHEVWLMEIFGPGKEWTPDSGRPGGVWCAQRIPDGEVGCSANRSRIGVVDLNDSDHFLASTNIFSLAEELGFWKPGTRFVWHDVYGGPGDRSNSLREWRALSLVAPSLGLKFTGDAGLDRYPFSVKTDQPVTVPKLIEVMRDSYEGTEFDVTAQPRFKVGNDTSPLACPWGPPELFDLLGMQPERAICTPTSGYVFVAQLRDRLPKAIGNLLWFAYGPANTSCFIPLYAGVTDLPHAWDHPANFTRIDRQQPQWNFRLVHNLAQRLPYRKVIDDVRAMIKPAEQRYLGLQPRLEQMAADVLRKQGPKAADALVTAYASDCARSVGSAYAELVDYLMLRYLVGDPEFARPALPRIPSPTVPEVRLPEAARSGPYHFDKTMPRHVLENYLSRAITMEGLLNGRGDLDDNIRMLKTIGAKFIGRSLCLWGGEANLLANLERARQQVPQVLAADPDMILQACIFEIVTTQVDQVPVPDWAFAALGLPVEKRNFRYVDMLYPNGRFKDHWRTGQSVPDVSRPETKLWFCFLGASFIDVGCEAIHFGQTELMNGNDPNLTHYTEVLDLIRSHANQHARRHMVLCDSHVPSGGLLRDGQLLMDFHSFPLRIMEVPDKPQEAILKLGFSDGIYGRSKGGKTFSGWTCDHLPYLVEIDNWGVSRQPGQPKAGGIWIWGYDEITWFAHQNRDYRSNWLHYAWDWVRGTDPNGYLQMPGSRTVRSPRDNMRWYYANNPSPAVPDGFGDEDAIRAVWATTPVGP